MAKHFGFRTAIFSMVAVCWLSLSIQAQILSCLPGQPCPAIPPDEILTKEDYMRSVLKHWTPSQISAWQSLDGSFTDWVASAMWRKEQLKEIARRNHTLVRTGYDPYFRLDVPSNCQLPTPVEPARNGPRYRGTTLHSYLTQDAWNQWEKIEPNFRRETEDEIYEEHYQLLRMRARLAWWQANAGTIENCIQAARAQALSDAQAVALHAEVVEDNEAIDRRWNAEIKEIIERKAPAQAKPETIERLQTLREIDKFIHDADRSVKAQPSPSPTHDIQH